MTDANTLTQSVGQRGLRMPIESFNDRTPVEAAPARVGSRGETPSPEVPLTSATGVPSLAQRAPGTDNLRADQRTLQAGDSRPTSSSGRGPSAPQSFADDRV